MTMAAYLRTRAEEEKKEKVENTPGYNALNRCVSSNSSSNGSDQINSGKKRM